MRYLVKSSNLNLTVLSRELMNLFSCSDTERSTKFIFSLEGDNVGIVDGSELTSPRKILGKINTDGMSSTSTLDSILKTSLDSFLKYLVKTTLGTILEEISNSGADLVLEEINEDSILE